MECVYPRGQCRICYNLLQIEYELQMQNRLEEFLGKDKQSNDI